MKRKGQTSVADDATDHKITPQLSWSYRCQTYHESHMGELDKKFLIGGGWVKKQRVGRFSLGPRFQVRIPQGFKALTRLGGGVVVGGLDGF